MVLVYDIKENFEELISILKNKKEENWLPDIMSHEVVFPSPIDLSFVECIVIVINKKFYIFNQKEFDFKLINDIIGKVKKE